VRDKELEKLTMRLQQSLVPAGGSGIDGNVVSTTNKAAFMNSN